MFKDRYDAANQLLTQLKKYKDRDDVVILGIPRGALEIGYVLAKELHAPLDVTFSKKISAPGQSELAIGAVSLHAENINPLYQNAYPDHIKQEKQKVRELLEKRYKQYRQDKQPIDLKDKIVIVTDDGIATGQTMLLALDEVKKQNPKKIVVAVPVAPQDILDQLEKKADEVICLLTPTTFWGISQFYNNFAQVEDEEAIRLLQEANA
ncbi:MAG: phosphoribosyltransferase family protein [Candidatus Babeliales bacterium]